MNLDDLLRDTLADDRWAVPVRPDALDRVRRSRAARQRRMTALALTGSAAVVGVAVLLTGQLGGAGQRVVQIPGASTAPSAASPTPLPGSTPGLYLTTGRDWFFDGEAADRFYATWIQPSPGPGAFVPSPAPLGPLSEHLADDVRAAGVPSDAQLRREDSSGGQVGETYVWVTLADGQTMYVYRSQLKAPVNLDGNGGEGNPRGIVEDVPGTGSALMIWPQPLDRLPISSNVVVVDHNGVATGWNSATIPLAQLKAWAIAAAQRAEG